MLTNFEESNRASLIFPIFVDSFFNLIFRTSGEYKNNGLDLLQKTLVAALKLFTVVCQLRMATMEVDWNLEGQRSRDFADFFYFLFFYQHCDKTNYPFLAQNAPNIPKGTP